MRFGMVIDLSRCVGCSACALACKTENNTRTRDNGQSFNWADFTMKTEGTFPNVTHSVIPVLCNHCSDAPCVKACPTEPKAMFKTPEGVTMHDPELCIGCQKCQKACPYSSTELGDESLDGQTYSVISYNEQDINPQAFWANKTPMIPGCTSAPADVAKAAGMLTPAGNKFVEGNAKVYRKDNVVEKCTFCYHRTSNGLQPACVEVCPSKARIFGDQDDAKSEISRVLAANKSMRLKEEKGTKPNVHYIGKFAVRS